MKATHQIAPLTSEEEKTLRALQERRQAFDAQRDSIAETKREKITTLDGLWTQIERLVQDKGEEQVGQLEDLRREHGSLVERVDKVIGDVEKLAADDQEAAGGGIGYDHKEAMETEEKGSPRRFSMTRAVIGHLNAWQGPHAKTLEAQLVREFMGQERALQLGVSSAGGFLVPPQWMGEQIELLRDALVLRILGARFRPLTGPASFRKMQNGAVSYWVAEGRKAQRSQQEWGRINLTPKPLVTLVPVSEDLLQMGPSGLEGDLEEDMALSQANTLDLAAMKGDGGEAEPLGMVNVAGGTTDWSGATHSGATQDVTDLLDEMIYAIASRNIQGNVAFAVNPLGVQRLRKTKDDQGRPLLFPAGQDGQADPQNPNGIRSGTLWGQPFAMTNALVGSPGFDAGYNDDLIAAVWSQIMVANFGATEIRPSFDAYDANGDQNAFLQREMWIRMTSRWDTAVRHTEAIQIATGFGQGTP